MIQRKLSKAQGHTVQVLAVQHTQLQAQLVEAQEALNELAAMYQAHFELPEGEVQFGQTADGWAITVTPKPEASDAVPSAVGAGAAEGEGDQARAITDGHGGNA